MLEGLRGDDSIAELCRKEGIAQSLYYSWSKEFMEAGKRRLAGDTARAATTGEVQDLRREARALKECVADLTLENRLLKKSMIADGGDDECGTRIRKARDHPDRRAVAPARQTHAGQARHRPPDVLEHNPIRMNRIMIYYLLFSAFSEPAGDAICLENALALV